MLTESPGWVGEVRREIKRLNNKIRRMEIRRDLGEVDEIDSLEDLSNWKGWRDALQWALKMRDGRSSRKQAWGESCQ